MVISVIICCNYLRSSKPLNGAIVDLHLVDCYFSRFSRPYIMTQFGNYKLLDLDVREHVSNLAIDRGIVTEKIREQRVNEVTDIYNELCDIVDNLTDEERDDDMVIYYSGHCSRGNLVTSSGYLPLDLLYNLHDRMIIIVDACDLEVTLSYKMIGSKLVNITPQSTGRYEITSKMNMTSNTSRYETIGSITSDDIIEEECNDILLIASCESGEKSFSSSLGSIFTRNLISTLQNYNMRDVRSILSVIDSNIRTLYSRHPQKTQCFSSIDREQVVLPLYLFS